MWWILASVTGQEPLIAPAEPIQVMLTGRYTEPVGVPGQDDQAEAGWMALRCQGGCRLEPVAVVLARGNGAYGVFVEGEPALALIRGLPAGAVSGTLIVPQPLPRYTSVKLGAGARLVADGGENYRMMLSVQGHAQPVLEHYQTSGQPGVRFVGDLDGDGALDLILDGGADERVRSCVLLLSSQAEPDQLVALAAEFSASAPSSKLARVPASGLEVVRQRVDLGTLGVEESP